MLREPSELVPSLATARPALVAHAETRSEQELVIRPAAVIPEHAARRVIAWLDSQSLERGGLWSVGAATGIWQRYDRPWDGPFGTRGSAQLLGTVYVTHDRPRRFAVVVHRVQVTEMGLMAGWTTTSLVDEVLGVAGLSVATCERDESAPTAYKKDPFKRPDAYSRGLVS